MRIAVIGTGNIGATLGGRFQQAGHQVTYGSRNPRFDGPHGSPVQRVSEALEGADVVLLALPGPAVEQFSSEHDLGSRVVIDATNNLSGSTYDARNTLARHAPQASYARAFNTLGWENFQRAPVGADLFFAADAAARPVIEQLITEVGLRPRFVGDADATGLVDALLPLWFALVKHSGGNRHLALRVIED